MLLVFSLPGEHQPAWNTAHIPDGSTGRCWRPGLARQEPADAETLAVNAVVPLTQVIETFLALIPL